MTGNNSHCEDGLNLINVEGSFNNIDISNATSSIASLVLTDSSFSTQIGNLETTSSNLVQDSASFSLDISNDTASIASLVLTDSSFSTQIGNFETTSSTITQATSSLS